jgi:RNA-directed DNA polymerase
MDEHRKSDSPIVPMKAPNKAGQPVAEGPEGRGLAKGNLLQQNAPRTQCRPSAPSALERVRLAAARDRKMRFTALLHQVYALPTLRAAYFSLKREAAAGVDGETWRHYGERLEENLRDLADRVKRGAYRAQPVRRVYIPKPDGRQRPLGVTALEDKLLQRATVEVLNAIYETDFLGFSYGFRPGRSPHHALDALYAGLLTRKVNWVLDLDIRGFFDSIDHGWLVKFIEHRIADRRVVRLIQKWLTAGVLEDGKRMRVEEGTPQGGSASPLLANIYLHYAFDLWVRVWRQKQARGDMIVVRMPMMPCSASSIGLMPSGSGKNSANDCASSDWSCTPKRPASWNSAHLRPKTERGTVKGSPRHSTSWASRISARRREVTECLRCLGRRCANGCRPS